MSVLEPFQAEIPGTAHQKQYIGRQFINTQFRSMDRQSDNAGGGYRPRNWQDKLYQFERRLCQL